jgi:hypothetical protein
MKKSEMYKTVQEVVLASSDLTNESKLEILRLLMNDEDVAKYSEAHDEETA